MSSIQQPMMAKRGDAELLAARLDASVATQNNLSRRNGTFQALINALSPGVAQAIHADVKNAGGDSRRRARRGSVESNLNSLFRDKGFTDPLTRFESFTLSADNCVTFSPRTEKEGSDVKYPEGQSLDYAAPGAAVDDTTSPDETKQLYIVPLEDALIFSLLAALQIYIRSGKRRDGLFNTDEAVDIVFQETSLAVGRSRVPGSLTKEIWKRLIVPLANKYGGIADVLVVLSAWSRGGYQLSAPVPDSWVMPSTPMTDWPVALKKTRSAILVFQMHLPHVLVGIADREMFIEDFSERIGARGDGCLCVTYGCLRRGQKSPGGDADSLTLGCPREVVIEECVRKYYVR